VLGGAWSGPAFVLTHKVLRTKWIRIAIETQAVNGGKMQVLQRARPYLLLSALILASCPSHVLAQANSGEAKPEVQTRGAERDGQHDFDFNIGTWKIHVSRLLHPLTGAVTWVEYQGVSVVRKVWNGRASLFELEVDGPAGHIEGVGLRLYNPQSHQWSLNWSNSIDGTLAQPMIGAFTNGGGEFYDQESFHGRTIFARNSFSNITPDSSRFEQAFSADGGKTWETNWVMTFTRAHDESGKAH
jgi:hypothetical protein